MPRASDGTVTLVAGNPVVANTDIVTTWANPTISDLASMAQDSLSRTGKGGMLVPFTLTDGTVSAPGIAFTNATNTGWYRTATVLAIAWAGVIKASFAAALARFYTAVQMDSTLTVAGASTLTGAVTVGGALGVTGAATFTGGIANAGGKVIGGVLTPVAATDAATKGYVDGVAAVGSWTQPTAATNVSTTAFRWRKVSPGIVQLNGLISFTNSRAAGDDIVISGPAPWDAAAANYGSLWVAGVKHTGGTASVVVVSLATNAGVLRITCPIASFVITDTLDISGCTYTPA